MHAGDGGLLRYSTLTSFETNDKYQTNCSVDFTVGYWYFPEPECFETLLMGTPDSEDAADALKWANLTTPIDKLVVMGRPEGIEAGML